MYSEKVMDHFNNPRNVGEIEDASGVGTVGNAKCGDIMRMYLDIDDNGIIQDVKFKTFGCGAAVATSSMATELVKGKTIQEALEVTNKAVMEALDGLPPVKVTVLCLQKKQFTLHSGITQRNTTSRSKVLQNRSLISARARKRKNTKYGKKESSRWNVRRRRFLGGSVSPEKSRIRCHRGDHADLAG